MSCLFSFLTHIFALASVARRSSFKQTNLNTGLRQTIVAMITSNMLRADHPSRVKLLLNSPGGRQTHILMDSVVMTDNLATVIENEVDRVLGSLDDMSEVETALRQTLALK